MSRRPADPRFAPALRRLRLEREMSLRDLAKLAVYGKSYLHELETGLKPPTLDVAARLDIALDAGASWWPSPGAVPRWQRLTTTRWVPPNSPDGSTHPT